MDLLMWFSFGCLAICSAATRCRHHQHCSDCDNTTGYCTTDCDRGYYDQKCRSACSKNCRNNTCITSNSGSENCTDGCVLGYQGRGCNIPCDSPGGNCTACPGGCDGGYCQLGSSCVSGCVDSYYGTDCKTCESLFIGLLALSVFVAFCILVTLYVSFIKFVNAKRDDNETEDVYHHLQRVPYTENQRCI
ncbi:cell death abnormality protein 1-like isoform X2 [Haliotis rubra]|uniref:cell death abnormality protein 1-like isoform X2 n=1 Tax=Haliotis rubra TaxID=36100 RepID=UPI001EE5F780|nr:cell death abnormality protein 1-like isoform X2 [Haliotis rubra]